MKTIFAAIENHKLQLTKHTFCKRLRSANTSDESIFFFVPHMTFFVLGFRDLLEYMLVPNPTNQTEIMLNQHCSEDSDHWLWFLQDLEKLTLPSKAWQGSKVTDALRLIWSPENMAMRRQIYDIMICIHNCQTAHEKLIIVECLEAAFAAFVENLNILTKRKGLYKELVYFGEHHYDKESDHTMGSWLDDGHAKQIMPHQAKYAMRENVIKPMIDNIFAGFDAMFCCWENAIKDSHIQTTRNTPQKLVESAA